MVGRVEGKVALVTGAASGIGRACAIKLSEEGARVVLTDVADAGGREVAMRIQQRGGDAMYFRHDVTIEGAWEMIVGIVRERYGRLDVLVNNAGIGIGGPIAEMTLEDWRRQQAINVEGVFLGVKHALPLMRAGGGGSIINMSSVAGLTAGASLAGYSATKGAVRLFSKAVAKECGALRDGVRVNSVHPGIIETPIWGTIATSTGMAAGAPGANAPDLDALSAMAVPMGIKGVPEDIAWGVLYLASDESRYVTGTELVIDGGISIR